MPIVLFDSFIQLIVLLYSFIQLLQMNIEIHFTAFIWTSFFFTSIFVRAIVELAIPCEKPGSRIFEGFTVGFHPRSWEIVRICVILLIHWFICRNYLIKMFIWLNWRFIMVWLNWVLKNLTMILGMVSILCFAISTLSCVVD